MSEEWMNEPCPGCEKMIDCTLNVCPFCRYDVAKGVPASAPKEEPKRQPKITPTPPIRHRVGQEAVFVPALGRMSGKAIDFSALHWPTNQEPTDENLLEWAQTLRDAWCLPLPQGGGENTYLSNHAIGYLASHADGKHDEPLKQNWERIVALLGGDDW